MVNYDNLPETKRNDKYFWISEIKSLDLIDIFGTLDKIPELVRTDKDFWLGVIEDRRLCIPQIYAKVPECVFSPEEQKTHFSKMARQDLFHLLSYYQELPSGIFTPDEQEAHWLNGLRQNLVALSYYDKMPPGLFTPKEQRSHWLEALERDHYAVLFHYDKIPQGIFTTEEQRMHWREMSEKDSRWIGAFDKFPEGLFSLEERQGYWKERLLEFAKEGMDWRLLSHYDKVKNYFTEGEQKHHWLQALQTSPVNAVNYSQNIPEVVRSDDDFLTVWNSKEFWLSLDPTKFIATPWKPHYYFSNIPPSVRNDKTFWLELIRLHSNQVLWNRAQIPQGIFSLQEQKEMWLEIYRTNPDSILYNYDGIPDGLFSLEEKLNHWLEAMRKCPNNVLGAYSYIPDYVLADDKFVLGWNSREFWRGVTRIKSDPNLFYYAERIDIPAFVWQDKDVWINMLNNSLYGTLYIYDKIPQGMFSRDEQKHHWLTGLRHYQWGSKYDFEHHFHAVPDFMRRDREFWVEAIAQDSGTVSRVKYNLVPPEIKNDKNFWTGVIKRNPIGILANYGIIPQEVFTPEEHIAYWIDSIRTQPGAVLAHYDKAPDVVKTHPEFIRQFSSVPPLLGLFDNRFSPETYSGKKVIGDEIADLMASVRSAAKDLRIDGAEGRTLGLEIEVDNNESWENRFGPTNDRPKLYLFVSRIKQLMDAIAKGGGVFDRSYYWNLHFNLGVTEEEKERWSEGYHVNRALEELVHLLIFPSNTLMRNLYNLPRLHTRNLVFMKKDITTMPERPEVGRIEIKEGSISGLTDTLYLQWVWGMIDYALRQDEIYAAELNAQFKEAYQRNELPITRTFGTSQDEDKRALEDLNQSGRGQSKMRRVRQDILEAILGELDNVQ